MTVEHGPMLVAIEVASLSVSARLVGAGLGLACLALGAWFWRRSPRRHGGREPRGRRLATSLLLLLGGGMLGGIWIEPGARPRLFLVYWTLLPLGAAILLVIAGWDLFVIRRRAMQDRSRLMEEARRQFQQDVEELQAKRKPLASLGGRPYPRHPELN